MLGGVTDVGPGWADNMRKSPPEATDDGGGIIDGQRGLRQVSYFDGVR